MKNKVFLNKIEDFIERAESVARMCSDQTIERSTDEDLAISLHTDYELWKLDFAGFLGKNKLYTEARLFRLEKDVPHLIGGLDYGVKNSLKSRNLIKAISKELGEKLEFIGKITAEKSKGTNKVTPNNKVFIFNLDNGELNRVPKGQVGCNFAKGKHRFKIMKILIEEADGEFIGTERLTAYAGYKTHVQCRDGIGKIRSKIQKTFKDIKENDFIESKQSYGYKLSEKITVDFEGTH